eukprot:10097007-Ditylum_brightwellii.AAC.1
MAASDVKFKEILSIVPKNHKWAIKAKLSNGEILEGFSDIVIEDTKICGGINMLNKTCKTMKIDISKPPGYGNKKSTKIANELGKECRLDHDIMDTCIEAFNKKYYASAGNIVGITCFKHKCNIVSNKNNNVKQEDKH